MRAHVSLATLALALLAACSSAQYEVRSIDPGDGDDQLRIRDILDAHQDSFRSCSGTQDATGPKYGVIDTLFIVNLRGKVLDVKPDKTSTLKTPEITECVFKKLREIHFPETTSQGSVEVTYSFDLTKK